MTGIGGHGRHGAGVSVLGRYRLDEQIAVGGMGVLWRAQDTALDETVALKRVSFAHLSEAQASITRDRTLREARLAAKLRGHPHVVSLYDVQVDDEDVWLVLEYVPSRSLSQLIAERGVLSHGEVARIGADVADALAAAHALGIQHRDVTPGNVLIRDDGRVKLADFGIAHSVDDPRITQTGMVVGTIPYLAPEMAREGESSAASDLFSLGATLYAALEGLPPFGRSENSVKLLHIVSTGVIRAPERAGELRPVLLRLLQSAPHTRPDATETRAALQHLQQHCQGATDLPEPRGALDEPDAAPAHRAGAAHKAGAVTDVEPIVPPARRSAAPSAGDEHDGSASRRSRARLCVAAGTIVLALVAASLIAVNTADHGHAQPPRPTVPTLPPFSKAIRMPADLKKVDVCRLINKSVLGQFGRVSPLRGHTLSACGAYVTTPDGAQASIDYEATDAETKYLSKPEIHDHRDLGGMRVYQGKLDTSATPQCRGEIYLADNSGFYAYAQAENRAGGRIDLCTMVRAASYAIMVRLAHDGTVPQSGWADKIPLSRYHACRLIDIPTLAAIDNLAYHDGYHKFADWQCHWGSGNGDDSEPSVDITFVLSRPEELTTSAKQARITIHGRAAYQDTTDPDEPWQCALTLPAQKQPTEQHTVPAVRIHVTSPDSPAANCAHARTMANAIADNLG